MSDSDKENLDNTQPNKEHGSLTTYQDLYDKYMNENKNKESKETKIQKRKLFNALKENIKTEKKFLKDLEKKVKKWKNNCNKNIEYYYKNRVEQDAPFLSEDNIDSYIKKYLNHKYLNNGDKQTFCDLFPKDISVIIEKNSTEIEAFQPDINCENQLQQCNYDLNFEIFRSDIALMEQDQAKKSFENCDKKLGSCNTELNELKSKEARLQKKNSEQNTLLQEQKHQINELEKEARKNKPQLHKLEEIEKRRSQFDTDWCNGYFFEMILEIFLWPYAAYNEKSILNSKLIKAGYSSRIFWADKRFVLSGLLLIVELTIIYIIVHRCLNKGNKDSDKHRNGKFTLLSLFSLRGGGDLIITGDVLDIIFIQIKLIKIQNEFKKLTLKSRVKTQVKKIKTTEINPSIYENKVEVKSNITIKAPRRKGKRNIKKNKKRIGRLSDFSNLEFENAEIIKTMPEKIKIKIRS